MRNPIKMYKCGSCGNEFYEPDEREENVIHNELDGQNVEYRVMDVCPECGSDGFDEGVACVFCDERFATYEDGEYCPECLRLVDDSVSSISIAMKQDWNSVKELFVQWSILND